MTPKRVDKDIKRRDIMEAALNVFSQKGLNNFKMIEVAEAAGVGKGTLYEYFASKDELIQACFEAIMDEWEGFVRSRMGSETDSELLIRTIITTTFEFFTAERKRLEVMYDFFALSVPRGEDSTSMLKVQPLYQRLLADITEIIKAGIEAGRFRPVEPSLAASMIMALIDGLFLQVALGVIKLDDNGFEERIADLALCGLIVRGNTL